jgi:SCP-2 sterol transfer family
MAPNLPATETMRVSALAGLSGRLRVDAGQRHVMLDIRDEELVIKRAPEAEVSGDAKAVFTCDTEDTARGLVQGTLNPVVAALQGRVGLNGDRVFGLKVLFALQTITPAAKSAAAALKR